MPSTLRGWKTRSISHKLEAVAFTGGGRGEVGKGGFFSRGEEFKNLEVFVANRENVSDSGLKVPIFWTFWVNRGALLPAPPVTVL